ncbi:MAG: polysaccharide export protein [Sphingomonadaceae bacterium]|nr:polysaccharide export protein [Sphingomonadaceae bacterium]
MPRPLRPFAPTILLAALSACATTPPLQSSESLQVVTYDAMPVPTATDLVVGARPVLVGPFDRLSIDVFGVSELSRNVQADASGRFAYPLVGTVEAGGKTPTAIAQEIEARLRGDYVRNPQVTVNVTESLSQRLTVDGEVTKPGLYPVFGEMTLMRAIAQAEGASEYADLKDVVIFREVSGQRYAGLYNLAAIRRGVYADPAVYAKDVIIVGDSEARRMFDAVLRAAPLITTPIIVLARN